MRNEKYYNKITMTILRGKVDARNAKERYKAEAATDKSMVVATFDLQAVLPSPKHNASAVYYKRKLSTYNLTIYCLADHACSFYVA